LARTWALRPELRPHAPWPDDVALYLAVPAALGEDAEAWRDAIAKARLEGVVVIGGEPESAVAWTKALGGRVAVAAFPDLRALRRRFRARGGEPWLVAISSGEADVGAAGAATGVAELLDRLRTCAGGQRSAAVLLPPGPLAALGAIAPDAVFAPDRAAQHVPALAPGAVIVDPSRPAGPAQWVERAIAALRGP
jgi:hypothetical protein